MTRTERRKNPDYRIAELEAQLALARENTQTNGQAYEDAMDRITELEAEKEQYDLNVVAWIQAETEVERLRETLGEAMNFIDAMPTVAPRHLRDKWRAALGEEA